MKKAISIILCICLCLAVMSVIVWADGEGIFSVDAGQPYPDRPQAEVVEGCRYVADARRGASAVYISGGEYTFDDAYFYGAGVVSAEDRSADITSKYGFCSTVYAASPGTVVTLNNPTVTSDPESNANGIFAANCAKVIVNGGTIQTNNGSNGHGLDATYMGHIYAYDTVIHTAGGTSGAIATDYGGGFLTLENCELTSEQGSSPGMYCAGSSIIMCKDTTIRANGSEGIVSSNDHGIVVLDNCYTYGSKGIVNGHQALPSPAMADASHVFIFGGTIETGAGPLVKVSDGHNEVNLMGTECILAENYENALVTTDSGSGILTVNLWDTEVTGNIYCGTGSTMTINVYAGAKLTGDASGDGTLVINVFDGGEYNGNFAATDAGEGEAAPVKEGFDYYLVNYWASGMIRWTDSTITTFTNEIEPVIMENSAATYVQDGASANGYDPELVDISENGVDPDLLNVNSSSAFGAIGSGTAANFAPSFEEGPDNGFAPSSGESAGDGFAPSSGESAGDGFAPSSGESAGDGFAPSSGESAGDGFAPSSGAPAEKPADM